MTERVGTRMMTYNTVIRMTVHGGTRMMTYGAEDTRDGTCGDTYDDIWHGTHMMAHVGSHDDV